MLHNVFFTDETQFHITAYVNNQNSNNPCVFHEVPLRLEKTGAKCAVS